MRTQHALAGSLAAASAAELHVRQEPETPCETALVEHADAINEMPTPPSGAEWDTFLLQQTHAAHLSDDPCVIAAVTGDPSLVSSYSALASEVTSWLDTYSDELQSVLSVCHDDFLYGPFISELDLPIHSNSLCESYSVQALTGDEAETTTDSITSTAAITAEVTEEPSETDDEAAATESESPDAAPRQTGMALAAMAAAGFAVAHVL